MAGRPGPGVVLVAPAGEAGSRLRRVTPTSGRAP